MSKLDIFITGLFVLGVIVAVLLVILIRTPTVDDADKILMQYAVVYQNIAGFKTGWVEFLEEEEAAEARAKNMKLGFLTVLLFVIISVGYHLGMQPQIRPSQRTADDATLAAELKARTERREGERRSRGDP